MEITSGNDEDDVEKDEENEYSDSSESEATDVESDSEYEVDDIELITEAIPLAALNALRRKKCLEKQLQQNDGILSTLEFQREHC